MSYAHLLAGKVDADGAVADLLDGHLELVSGDTTDDDVADSQAVGHGHVGLLLDNVLLAAEALATAEALYTSDIDRVDLSTVVCQQSGQWSSNNLGAVNDGDSATKQSLSIVEDGVVDVEMFENLDHGQGCAGEDALLGVVGRVEEADVLVHVVDEDWAKTFDILVHVDDVL